MISVDDVRALPLFAGLTDAQLGELVEAGAERAIEPGVVLFTEGDRADFWWLLVDGEIELVRHVGREDVVVGRMDTPGRWAGGFRAWDEHGVYLATGRGVQAGRVLCVPAPALRAISDEWFPFGSHLIAGLYTTARTVESTARQRESLVTLGTLAAGLAHELNNPAAATTRAVDALSDACDTLLSSLGRLADGQISAAQFSALDALRKEVRPPDGPRTALEVADQEEKLSAWLRGRVDNEWLIAPSLAAAGIDVGWCERVEQVLPGEPLAAGLEWVASSLSAASLLSQVKESTRRVSELVGAVKSYSQMDRSSTQRLEVTEGIESTLLVLGHKLGDGITVERDYATDVPKIDAYPGELNQVWTNLIDNAVDAMEGNGTLLVRTRSDGETVVVEIGDTGPGMSPEVQARAFDAFFSTKEVGKGTGLGLDIASRIVVDRHGGSIEIESAPGRTVLRVSLPTKAAPRKG
ncbi:MAG: hypothetical protein QOK14_390 [Frankiaceae bacterium]|nr:hypothetical protein [Frankiaceae bacterium]